LPQRRLRFSNKIRSIPDYARIKSTDFSAAYGKTIHAVEIAGDLRAAFYVEGNIVWSVDIGDHDIYRP